MGELGPQRPDQRHAASSRPALRLDQALALVSAALDTDEARAHREHHERPNDLSMVQQLDWDLDLSSVPLRRLLAE